MDELPDDDEYPRFLLDSDKLQEGDFVLVQFDQKPKNVFYVGKVVKVVDQNDFDIKFMRKQMSKFVFPKVNDFSKISRVDIISKLPAPIEIPGTSRVQHNYRFAVNFDLYNMR